MRVPIDTDDRTVGVQLLAALLIFSVIALTVALVGGLALRLFLFVAGV